MNSRYVFWFLLSPSQLLLLGLLAGALLLAIGRRGTGRVLTVLSATGVLVFGILPGSVFLARPLEARFPQPELPSEVTGIILLTGAEETVASEVSGTPQVGVQGQRYITALGLAARHPGARIVVSGGPIDERGKAPLGTQSGVARALLESLGLDGDRVWFEQQSRDTCDNAANTKSLLRPKAGEAWVVVTSAMHMPRTVACFRAAGWPEVIAQPAGYQAAPGLHGVGTLRIVSNLALLDLALHEWLGLAYYRWTGRTTQFYPSP